MESKLNALRHCNAVCAVHTAPFLYKNANINIRFCEAVYTTSHKNGGFEKRHSKTKVCENAVDKCEHAKTDIFLDHSIVKG